MALDRLDAGRAKLAAVVGDAKRSGRTGGRSEWGRWFEDAKRARCVALGRLV